MNIFVSLVLLFHALECSPFTQDDVDQLQSQINDLEIDKETLETRMDHLKEEISLLEYGSSLMHLIL